MTNEKPVVSSGGKIEIEREKTPGKERALSSWDIIYSLTAWKSGIFETTNKAKIIYGTVFILLRMVQQGC